MIVEKEDEYSKYILYYYIDYIDLAFTNPIPMFWYKINVSNVMNIFELYFSIFQKLSLLTSLILPTKYHLNHFVSMYPSP